MIIPRNNASDANAAGSFNTDLPMTSSPEQNTNIVPYLFEDVKRVLVRFHHWSVLTLCDGPFRMAERYTSVTPEAESYVRIAIMLCAILFAAVVLWLFR